MNCAILYLNKCKALFLNAKSQAQETKREAFHRPSSSDYKTAEQKSFTFRIIRIAMEAKTEILRSTLEFLMDFLRIKFINSFWFNSWKIDELESEKAYRWNFPIIEWQLKFPWNINRIYSIFYEKTPHVLLLIKMIFFVWKLLKFIEFFIQSR